MKSDAHSFTINLLDSSTQVFHNKTSTISAEPLKKKGFPLIGVSTRQTWIKKRR